jgi:division protein 1
MMFDARRIVAAAGEPTVKIYDKGDHKQWDCPDINEDIRSSIVQQVRLKDGFMIEGRRNGEVGVWTC